LEYVKIVDIIFFGLAKALSIATIPVNQGKVKRSQREENRMDINDRIRNGIVVQEILADLVLNCEINEALVKFIEHIHFNWNITYMSMPIEAKVFEFQRFKMCLVSLGPFACEVIDTPRFLCCIDFEMEEHLN